MALFEDTNPHELKELLRQIHGRETALPDFQRDFVWDPYMTQELVSSIASNYPAGSLLRIRNTHNLFAYREFQGAPPLEGQKPTYLVLDGQQRLTSLFQAFYGLGDHRYFVNVRRLLESADFDECIFHLRSNVKKAKEYEALEVQARELILPLSVLRDGYGDFLNWMLRVAERAPSAEARIALQEALMRVGTQWVQAIDDYKFPVVTLSDMTSAEAVCTIFETLNRTGVKLTAFDLLTARFWPQNLNLRQLWSQAQKDYPIIGSFQVDPYYLLQVVSLAERDPASCRRSDVLSLKVSAIQEWWDRAVWGLAKSLEMLRYDCGVIVPKWLPYNTILVPLAAVLAKMSGAAGPQVAANKDRLVRWYWCSVFGQTYESAANSQAAKDVTELLAWLQGHAEPETVRAFRFDPRVLRYTTVRQRAVYRGAICLILRNGPRDFHQAAPVTAELIEKQDVDDHHVFPQAYLARHSIKADHVRDCVLNRTLIDSETNKRIGDRAPSDYMVEIRGKLGLGSFRKLLDSHLLPGEPGSSLESDDYEAFLNWRQEALWTEIRTVTGVKGAADLVAEDGGA